MNLEKLSRLCGSMANVVVPSAVLKVKLHMCISLICQCNKDSSAVGTMENGRDNLVLALCDT